MNSFETPAAEINVESVMYEIRDAIARQQRGVTQSIPASNSPSRLREIDALKLQPDFEPGLNKQYHINDLLRFHSADFVRNSYRALLQREPEEIEIARNLEQLASGRFNKVDILASLHSSPEGRQAGVKLSGLSIASTVRRLGRIPVVGYLLRLITATFRLPHTLQHQSKFELYLCSQLERIVEHQNSVQRNATTEFARISAQILDLAQKSTAQQQAVEEALKRHEQLLNHVEEALVRGLTKARESNDATVKSIERLASESRQQLAGQQQTIVKQQDDLLTYNQQFKSDVQKLVHRQQRATDELRAQEQRLTVLLEQVRRNAPLAANDSFTQLAIQEEDHLLDALYAAFEDQFRGNSDEVRRRLEVYLPFLRQGRIGEAVLDVGCGRGEWLQLLNNEGIEGWGVDHNRVFVERCRGAGLNVVEADALGYLRSLPSGSLKCVTSFHLVEHLPFAELMKLLDAVFRVLRPGGLLILETPNPENFIVGSCNFYTDPTHRNPIPNQTLQFLIKSLGFENLNVLKLRPLEEARLEGDSEIVRRFNEYFYSAPDYGVIASKPNPSV